MPHALPPPPIVTTVAAVREAVQRWRRDGQAVALVPTMGALHEGHLDLVRLAKSRADRVVVSIFVNPAQFAPHEDFDRYPRAIDADASKLATVTADLVYAPTAAEMYPPSFATRIVPGGAADGLESDFRPHFFGGVVTVCCKLFMQVAPDFAVFGEKDYQQLAVVRQLVRDLNLPLSIIGMPTRRDMDGVALSSRNAYLTPEERGVAPVLHSTLQMCAAAIRAGTSPAAATDAATAAILAAGFTRLDYVAARDALTLAPLSPPPCGKGRGQDDPLIRSTPTPTPTPSPQWGGESRPVRILAAAWLGKTRLIDNVGV